VLEHVFRLKDRRRPLEEEPVRAPAGVGIDRAGHDEDLAALIGGVTRCP
jgi:hypothetical protein